MSNLDIYTNIFVTTFNITKEKAKDLKYQDIQEWDSVGHMGLIAAIEESCGIMMESDDIVDFSSFEKGKEILKKYNIEMKGDINV
jgi:acyl carrier protein